MTLGVSVVMTAYNQAEYLGAAIDSVLSQTEPPAEFFVVDDGSTDGTPKALRDYGDKIQVITRENRGQGAARNSATARARQPLIAYCDADDIHLPYRLEAHRQLFEHHDEVGMVFSDLQPLVEGVARPESVLRGKWLGPIRKPLDEEIEDAFVSYSTCASEGLSVPPDLSNRRVYVGDVPELIALTHIAWGGASMFRRQTLLELGGNNESLRRYTDWHLSSRFAKRGPIAFVDIPVVNYRMHPEQLTKKGRLGAECYLAVLEEVWKSDAPVYAKYQRTIDRALGSAHAQLAEFLKQDGDKPAARNHLLDSIRANPRQKRVYAKLLANLV